MGTQDLQEIALTKREITGKSAAKAIRRGGAVPVVLYAAGRETSHAQIEEKGLVAVLKKGSPLVELRLPEGEVVMATLKEIQYDPVSDRPIHVDFYEVHAGELVTVHVSLVTIGESPGVKMGGVVDTHLRDVEIKALPRALPEHIVVDISELEMNDTVHLSDIPLPEGVEFASDPSTSVLSIVPPTIITEDEPEEGLEEGIEGAEGEEGADAAPADGEGTAE